MKTISKILSVLLVVAMLMSFIAVVGTAEENGTLLAKFDFAASSTPTAWVDGGDMSSGKTYTVGDYQLKFTDCTKVYCTGNDANGVGFIKFGTSKVGGTLTFTVPDDVDYVELYLAAYKANTAKYTINGGSTQTSTKTSSTTNGTPSSYDVVKVDTSSTKTVTISTASGGWRMVMFSVLYYGKAAAPEVPADPNVSTEGWNGDGHTTGWTVKDGVIKGDRTVSGSTHRIWKELITDADNYVVSVDMAFSTKTDIYVKVMGIRVDFDARSGHGAQFIPKYECGGWHDLDGWVESSSGNVKFERVQGGDVTITFTCGDNVKTATVTPTETGNLNVELGNEDGNGASFATFSNLTVTTPEAPVVPAEPSFEGWTNVWDLETAPDSLNDWCSNKFAGWGNTAVPEKWEPSVVAGKGIAGSKALCWHYKQNAWGTTTFIEFAKDSGAITDWTGATELMFYIDTTDLVNGEDNGGTMRLDIGLNASDMNLGVNTPDASFYYWKDGAWVEAKVNVHKHLGVPVGYQGYVRVPFTAITECPSDLSSVTKILFWMENKWDVGTKVYFDNFMINVEPKAPACDHADAQWKHNDEQHWKECSCGYTSDKENHDGNDKCVCGYEKPCDHANAQWKHNDEQHWKECSCGYASNKENHDGNDKCVCGYEKPVAPPVSTETYVEFTVDSLGLKSQNYTAGTTTVNGIAVEWIQLGNYGDGIQMRDKNGNTSMFWNTAAVPGKITKIEFVYSDTKTVGYDNNEMIVNFGNSAKGADCAKKLLTIAGTKEYTITPDGDYSFFYIEWNTGYTSYWKSIKVYYTASGETPDVPTCDHAADKLTWKHNDDQHWQECACGHTTAKENHDGNDTCVCGYEKPVAPTVEKVTIKDGTYYISAAGKFLASLAQDKTYGYPGALDASDETCVYTVVNAADGMFYLKDAYGRYVYNTGTYKNFSTSETQPENGGLWMVIKSGDKQLLVSVETNRALQFGVSYGTFQFVDDHATADAVTFTATASEPSQTGDASMIVAAAVVAVMSAAGMALLLKKKEF